MTDNYEKAASIYEWLGVLFDDEETREAIALVRDLQKLLFERPERQRLIVACHEDN